MAQPDILIFLSDQHGGLYTSIAGDSMIETPTLDRLQEAGVVFSQAYTPSPLCVPARSSFLTAQLPNKTGIFDNKGAIAEDKATFLHSLAIEGYETVLIGRMHFLGHNQRHGFTKRLVGDFTITNWGEKEQFLKEQKGYQRTLSAYGCTNVVGAGDSPVLEYDRAVIDAALQYLGDDHDKPQCIVVGTYAPHFSYVAPPDLFANYYKQMDLPVTLRQPRNYEHPIQDFLRNEQNPDHIRAMRAAYYGMITNLDRQIGLVYDAFEAFKKRNHRKGLFVYTSDHGDQIGERHIYGKMTHYEGATKIPFVVVGDDIKQHIAYDAPVNLIDLGVTLCDIVGATPPPDHDGQILTSALYDGVIDANRTSTTEFVRVINGNIEVSRSLRKGPYKLICYADHPDLDLLFNVVEDRFETTNLRDQLPDVYQRMKTTLSHDWDVAAIKRTYQIKAQNHRLINRFGDLGVDDFSERRPIPEHATTLPKLN